MLLNGKSYGTYGMLRHFGCSCHNTKNSRRSAKHTLKRQEKNSWKREARNYN